MFTIRLQSLFMVDATEPSRRARLREQTVADIKAAARKELMERGGYDLSLRSVAREVGMTPSALYRYFESRDELITEIVTDGFRSLAVALKAAAADGESRGLTGCDRWVNVAQAHRRWALDNPSEYAVAYARNVNGYNDDKSLMVDCVREGVDVMFGVMIAAIQEGSINVDAMEAALTDQTRTELQAWKDEWQLPLSPGALAACLYGWTQLHGFINLEMYGHYPIHVQNLDALFEQQMRAALSVVPF
jgi:AcrR family transcriptional regulator